MSIIKVNTNILFLVLVFFTLVVYSNLAISYAGTKAQGSIINDSEYDKSKNKYFIGLFTNQGTITDSKSTDGGGLRAEGHFTNEGSISIAEYLTEFQATLTNAKTGIILAAGQDGYDISLKVIGAVSNAGSITTGINITSTNTSGGKTLFYSEVTNSGTIITKGTTMRFVVKGKFPDTGLEVTGTVYNLLEGSISVYSGKALFHKMLSNRGYLVVKGSDMVANADIGDSVYNNISLVVEGTVSNFVGAHIELDRGKFLLQNELSNSGIISANGYAATNTFAALEVAGRAYNAGTITAGNNKNKAGAILFAKELINKGIIDSKGCQLIFIKSGGRKKTIGFEVSGTAYNFKEASISVAIGKALFRSELTNSGTIFACGKHYSDHIALEVSGTVYNSGSIAVTKGSALCNSELTNTQTGVIIASGSDINHIGLEITGTLYNAGSITITKGYLKLHDYATNDGYIDSQKTLLLPAGKNITNKGHFVATGITVSPQTSTKSVSCFYNRTKKAKAEFKSIINEPYLNIDNQGSFFLQGSITIGSYDGNADSELFLLLDNRFNKKSFLQVTNKAMFANGLTNTGVILIKGQGSKAIGLEITKTLYNLKESSISITSGKALLYNELTNSGTIIASGTDTNNIALEVSGTVYNAGSITITKGKALFNNELTNSGTIIASGTDTNDIALEVFGKAYNSGSNSVKTYNGKATFANGLTNTGAVIAQGQDSKGIGLEITKTLYNLKEGSISITLGKGYIMS